MKPRNFRLFQVLTSACVLLALNAGPASKAESKAEMKPPDVKALVMGATTSADHEKLARHFIAMAEKHEQEAQEHDVLAIEYANNPSRYHSKGPMGPDTVAHCKYFAEHCRKAAQEMRYLAEGHEAMAKAIRDANGLTTGHH